MRVAINGHYLQRRMSGLARYARQIKSFLDDEGHQVDIILPPRFLYRPGGQLRQMIRFLGLTATEMLAPPVLLALGRNDLHISPAFAAPLGLFSSRYIVVYHDLAFAQFHSLYSRLERLYLHLNLWLLRLGHHRIVVPSEYVKSEFCGYTNISPDRVTVISPYCEFEVPAVATKRCDRKYFLLLSNAHPRKNLAATVAGFHASQAVKSGYDLLIVGNFELPVALDSPNIHVLSGISDAELQALLTHAAALVLFSLSEGFGFPIVEAARLGVISLTSETGSLGELIAPDRSASQATTEQEIRDKINLFLTDPGFVTVLEKDRAHVDQKYSRQHFSKNWRNLIDGDRSA